MRLSPLQKKDRIVNAMTHMSHAVSRNSSQASEKAREILGLFSVRSDSQKTRSVATARNASRY
jgi:hypothetical protein